MRRTYLLFGICVVLALGVMVWGAGGGGAQEAAPPARYALLLADDRGTAVLQFKQGAQTAAEEAAATLAVYTAEHGQPAAAQLLPVLEGLAGGAVDGIILQPGNAAVLDAALALAADEGIPLVYWGEDDRASACVLVDRAQQGRLVGEAYRADAGEGAELPYVLMLDTAAQRAVLGGVLEATPARSHAADTGAGLLRHVAALPEGTPLLILDGEMAGRIARATQGRFPIWCVDPGDDRANLLEVGYVRAIAMDMPYAQGYQAVMALGGEGGETLSPCRLVTRENMYTAENVKLMFPLLQ